jgi:hypothetical protein
MNKSFSENLKNWNEVIYLRCELIYNKKKFEWNFVSLRDERKTREKYLGNMCLEGIEIKTRVSQLHNAHVYGTIHKILIRLDLRFSRRWVWRLLSSDDGGSKDLWNVGKILPDCTVLQPRRQQSSY